MTRFCTLRVLASKRMWKINLFRTISMIQYSRQEWLQETHRNILVSGSSAARVCLNTQKASRCPHLGHSVRVRGKVGALPSITVISFSFPLVVKHTGSPVLVTSQPHIGFLHMKAPLSGFIMLLHLGQNI